MQMRNRNSLQHHVVKRKRLVALLNAEQWTNQQSLGTHTLPGFVDAIDGNVSAAIS